MKSPADMTTEEVLAAIGQIDLDAIAPEHKPEAVRLIAGLREKLPVQWIDESFECQKNVLLDESRFICIVGPRRMAKSNTVFRKIAKRSERYPKGKQGAMSLYVGLTQGQARRFFWEPAVKAVLEQVGILNKCKLNESEMTCAFPNGHILYCMGMESQDKIRERARGGGFATVAPDEAATFAGALDTIVTDIVLPATADVLGTIMLTGTPGYVKAGIFHRATGMELHNRVGVERWVYTDKPTATEWSCHRWTGSENPYMKTQLEHEIKRQLSINPRIMDTPSYQRETLGLWVKDDSKFCYRYAPGRNDYMALPDLPKSGWHHVLALDLGFRPDPCAFVILAWHDHSPVLYIREAFEKLEMFDSDIVAKVHEYEAKYGRFDRYIIDGAELRTVEEMRKRDNIPWEATPKTGKAEMIELMNDSWLLGNIKVHETATAWGHINDDLKTSMVEELCALTWDLKALDRGERKENPGAQNHSLDGALYGFRACYQYLSEIPEKKPAYGSDEFHKAEEAEIWQRRRDALEKQRRNAQGDEVPDPWENEQSETTPWDAEAGQ